MYYCDRGGITKCRAASTGEETDDQLELLMLGFLVKLINLGLVFSPSRRPSLHPPGLGSRRRPSPEPRPGCWSQTWSFQ